MVRRAMRWDTKFGRWVGNYGVRRLAGELARSNEPVTVNAVYGWVAGERVPRPERALAIVRLSAGELRLEDIYGERLRS